MRVRVGVIGCGLISQVMHLPYLSELADRFEVVAVCDLSPTARRFAGSMFPAAREHESWERLLEQDLDAALVCTSGSHAEIVVEAARRGIHALVEKPLCFGAREGMAMVAAAEAGETVLMVGYMKRYDPAFEHFARMIGSDEDIAIVRVTTLESPPDGFVAQYPMARARDVDPPVLAALERDDRERVKRALGEHDETVYNAYRFGLLDSLVHELNLLRALLGEPDLVRFAHLWLDGAGIQTSLRFGSVECQLAWVQLPGIARFEQELAIHTSARRLTLSFPSPFLRNMPTRITEVGGEPGTSSSWQREDVVGYDEAFRRELEAFHRAVAEGERPRTGAGDALRDVALCEAVARSFITGCPVPNPTASEAA